MKLGHIALFGSAQMAAAFDMFPTLTPPVRRPSNPPRPYHQPDRDAVLMDWDLPKGKRARRRARGRARLMTAGNETK